MTLSRESSSTWWFPSMGEPQYRPHNTFILNRDPEKGTPNFGKPPHLFASGTWWALEVMALSSFKVLYRAIQDLYRGVGANYEGSSAKANGNQHRKTHATSSTLGFRGLGFRGLELRVQGLG